MKRQLILLAGALAVSALMLAVPPESAEASETAHAANGAVLASAVWTGAPVAAHEAVLGSPIERVAEPMAVADHDHGGGHEGLGDHDHFDNDGGFRGGFGGFYGAYDPFWTAGWGPYWAPYWGYYGPGYGAFHYNNWGALKLKVTGPNPKDAEVFADGGYVGTVHDFNGVFSHLNLRPGNYTIEIRAKGYQPLTFKVHIPPDQTVTYHGALQPAS